MFKSRQVAGVGGPEKARRSVQVSKHCKANDLRCLLCSKASGVQILGFVYEIFSKKLFYI